MVIVSFKAWFWSTFNFLLNINKLFMRIKRLFVSKHTTRIKFSITVLEILLLEVFDLLLKFNFITRKLFTFNSNIYMPRKVAFKERSDDGI